jgi:hypothetical protein
MGPATLITCPGPMRPIPRLNQKRKGRDELLNEPWRPAVPWPSRRTRPAQTCPQNPSAPQPDPPPGHKGGGSYIKAVLLID